jgi:hypothetical protein
MSGSGTGLVSLQDLLLWWPPSSQAELQPSLTVHRKPHLLAGEAHSVGGCAHIGPCILGGRLGNDQGAVLAHIVADPGGQGNCFLERAKVTSAEVTRPSPNAPGWPLWFPRGSRLHLPWSR